MLLVVVADVEVIVDLTGADDSGSRWAAGLGLEAPGGFWHNTIIIYLLQEAGFSFVLTEGPPTLGNLPFDMGFAAPGFFLGTGLETLFGGSPEGT